MAATLVAIEEAGQQGGSSLAALRPLAMAQYGALKAALAGINWDEVEAG